MATSQIELVPGSKIVEGDVICIGPGVFKSVIKFDHVYEEHICVLAENGVYYSFAPTDEIVRRVKT